MKLSGEHEFHAPAAEVYERLLDPDLLRSCMPGCEALEPLSDEEYKITLAVPIPAVKGQYEGTVKIVDQKPPSSFRMKIEVTGQSGFVNADASMRIVPGDADSSVVEYEADAQIGGPAASVEQRVLTGISRRQVDQMMRCLDAGGKRPGIWARFRSWLKGLFRSGASD